MSRSLKEHRGHGVMCAHMQPCLCRNARIQGDTLGLVVTLEMTHLKETALQQGRFCSTSVVIDIKKGNYGGCWLGSIIPKSSRLSRGNMKKVLLSTFLSCLQQRETG